tara:strand:- start:7479 stop:8942 length:1464 start_codon:yes stop_codon:yes gene_type:complete
METKNQLPFILSDNLACALSDKDSAHIDKIADKIKAEDPKLATTDYFGSNVRQGYRPGPVLFYEDHRSIALSSANSFGHYQYRFLLLARQDDILLVEHKRALKYENYCRNILKLPSPEIICLDGEYNNSPLAKRCSENTEKLKQIAKIAKQSGCINIMPYISTGWTWVLAQRIAEIARVPVYVMAPPPRLTQKTNDKLWFSERLVECIGHRALPKTYYAFGPASLAIKVSRLAKTHSQIVIKIPSSASSMGNILISSSKISNMTLAERVDYLSNLIQFYASSEIFPLAVSAWDSDVITSPSLQVWIPRLHQGPPIVEGLFEQALDPKTHAFIGAKPALLQSKLEIRLIYEASMICHLFQKLGYYGRCSIDAVVAKSGNRNNIHWIDCNARWGGVSIPMTAANRLTGCWQNNLRIIVQSNINEHNSSSRDLIDATADLRYNSYSKKEGIVIMNPPKYENTTYNDYMVFADTKRSENEILHNVKKVLGT